MYNIEIKNLNKASKKTLFKIYYAGLKDDFSEQCSLWYPVMLELKKRKLINQKKF